MKKYISKLILSIISLPLISFGQQLNLDNSLTISSGSDGFGRPRIALTIMVNNNLEKEVLKSNKGIKWNNTALVT